MAVLEILRFPDARLRRRCDPVQEISASLKTLAEDMLETMYAAQGLGLSAVQVNHFVRLLTADTRIKPDKNNSRYEKLKTGELEKSVSQPVVLFNPKIISKKGKVVFTEGCLSFPSYYADVKRADTVEVEGWDLSGKTVSIKTDGVLSVCLQHEIDHLNGRLFIDHLSPIKADQLRAEIKKHGYPEDKTEKKTPG